MIDSEDVIRTASGLLLTCVEMRMSLEDFIEVAESQNWLVQKFTAFEEISVYANDGLNLCACWTFITNEQSKAIYWSGKYE